MKSAFLVVTLLLLFSIGCAAKEPSPKGEPLLTGAELEKYLSTSPSLYEEDEVDQNRVGVKGEITNKDLQLGFISLWLPYKNLKKTMKLKPIKVENSSEAESRTYYYSDGTIIGIYKEEDTVDLIKVVSPQYPTPRGLKVGDSVEKLKSIYGEPVEINDDDGSWTYGEDCFHIWIKKGKVSAIQVNLTC